MRQRHPSGELLFVDYAGQTLNVGDSKTGALRSVQIFVATLGASSYTYVEGTWTQSLPDWISNHIRTFEYLGGVPAQVVCDNLKSGVIKACRYDPEINRTYADMALYYDVSVIPTRPGKPKDKAKVEGAVLIVERWILAKLRNVRFFSLEEVNDAIGPLMEQLNGKDSRHLGACRRELFMRHDKPLLKPLPVQPYVYADWKQCCAGLDYHVRIDGQYYSVPHAMMKQKFWARITTRTVEFYQNEKKITCHIRVFGVQPASTHREHMIHNHRFWHDFTPESLKGQADKIGPNVEQFIDVLLADRTHTEQARRTSMGVRSLAREYGWDRVDAACKRALRIKTHSYTSLASILKSGLDRKPCSNATDAPAITHSNIRGANYFNGKD